MIEALLASGKYKVFSLAGAVKHNDYTPVRVDREKWGDDWMVIPVDGYGNHEILRKALMEIKPDVLWFMTDPRFYEWLWLMEDEIRSVVPTVYYHVWDNFPVPKFNKDFYDSTDAVVTISKVTSKCVQEAAPDTEEIYHPHAVDPDIFKKLKDSESISRIRTIRESMDMQNKTMFFWNNRNARRKQSGSLIFWFKDFLDKVGHDKASLVVHTDPMDPHGQPLEYLIQHLDLNKGQVWISKNKLPSQEMALLYNAADCVINIADAEGFGLSSLEALSCETPVINTMTGGLQEQVFNGEEYFGVGIEPCSKAIIGSQQVPFIYEDRVSGADVSAAFETIHNMSREEREEIGKKARKHVEQNYNFKKYKDFWVHYLEDIHRRHGSWDTRKNYTKWEITEL